jgi:hypothetical protein
LGQIFGREGLPIKLTSGVKDQHRNNQILQTRLRMEYTPISQMREEKVTGRTYGLEFQLKTAALFFRSGDSKEEGDIVSKTT